LAKVVDEVKVLAPVNVCVEPVDALPVPPPSDEVERRTVPSPNLRAPARVIVLVLKPRAASPVT